MAIGLAGEPVAQRLDQHLTVVISIVRAIHHRILRPNRLPAGCSMRDAGFYSGFGCFAICEKGIIRMAFAQGLGVQTPVFRPSSWTWRGPFAENGNLATS